MREKAIRRPILSTSAAVLALAASTNTAFGKEASPEARASASADAKADAAYSQLEQIIVTAQRREQSQQDVPISMTVVSQEDLTKRNVAVAADLAAFTPSLSVNQRWGPEKSSFSIRGFNQDQYTAPTVGVYFAEVVGVRVEGGTTAGNTVGAGSFTDLENVQVLKGPQGTLFGRNTTGGAILLTPKKPTDEFEGYLEATSGNYDQQRLQGAINIPISEKLKVRAAVETNQRDGYMKNKAGVGADAFNDIDYIYGRLGILAELTPEIQNYSLFHYSDSSATGYGSRIVGCNTNATGGAFLQATSCVDQLARQQARGDSLYDIEARIRDPFVDIEHWQFINTTTWQITDNTVLKNIVSYGELRERVRIDAGSNNFVVADVNNQGGFNLRSISPAFPSIVVPAGTPYDRVVVQAAHGGHTGAGRITVEELQLQGASADGRLQYVMGGYLEFGRPLDWAAGSADAFLNCVNAQDYNCTNPLSFGSITETKYKYNFDNHGVYSQGTYNFNEQFALTAGLRWTFDKIEGRNESTAVRLSNQSGSYIDPRTGVSILRTCYDTLRLPNTVVTDASACRTQMESQSDAPTWTINLDYKPSADHLLYAKYSRGYRQGGMVLSNIGLESSEPEQLDSYEIGSKLSFASFVDGYLNVAAFYNDLTDMQVPVALRGFPGATPSTGTAMINAGSAESYGIEVDAFVLLTPRLRLAAGYAYLKTEIAEVDDAAALVSKLVGTPWAEAFPRVTQGNGFLDTPKHKLTLDASYKLPIDEKLGDVAVGATWIYTSKYVTNYSEPAYFNGFPLGVTPAGDLLNLNLDWKNIGGSSFDLALFATNVTDEEVKVPNQNSFNNSGVAEVSFAPPRMYGARLRYNFGE